MIAHQRVLVRGLRGFTVAGVHLCDLHVGNALIPNIQLLVHKRLRLIIRNAGRLDHSAHVDPCGWIQHGHQYGLLVCVMYVLPQSVLEPQDTVLELMEVVDHVAA